MNEMREDINSVQPDRPSQKSPADERSQQVVTCWKWRQALPNCSDEVLHGLVDTLYETYLGNSAFNDQEEVQRLMYTIFPTAMDTPHADITRYYRYFEAYIFELWIACINRKCIKYDENKELQRRLTVILERHKLVTTIRQNMALLRETADITRPVTFSSLDTLQLIKEDEERLNPYQRSLLIALNECYRHQYCRRGENIYERVFYGRQFTHAYKFLSNISDFVYSVSGQDKTSTAWETMTTTHNLVSGWRGAEVYRFGGVLLAGCCVGHFPSFCLWCLTTVFFAVCFFLPAAQAGDRVPQQLRQLLLAALRR